MHSSRPLEGIGKSIRPQSWRALPARRNSLCERDPDRAYFAHYVNFAPLRTPGGDDGSEFSGKERRLETAVDEAGEREAMERGLQSLVN